MRVLALLIGLLPALAFAELRNSASAEDGLDVTSRIIYEIRPDTGTRHVSWQITIVNNDPATSSAGSGGQVLFYEALSFPVMAGAQNLSATSGGTRLDLTTTPIPDSPIDAAEVTLDSPLFFGETYSISLSYDIADTRREGLLVTSAYAFVPLVALGDNATVEVNLPTSLPWEVSLEAAECAGDQSPFTCSGSDGIYVAALSEITRPDLTANTTTEVQLGSKKLNIDISFFQGEDAFAHHVKELAVAALPVMEELYGFSYTGPEDVLIEERGRVITLGYEGLADCNDRTCDIAVSPVANDHTILHELAHLWSGLYENRWLAEGFAEFIAEEAASRLPAGLVSGSPDEFPQPNIDLQLDDWAGVNIAAGLSPEKRDMENAGYYRSKRFLYLLQAEAGPEAIQRANAALAAESSPVDSERFMDAIEEASGRNNDALFQEWVFPSSHAGTLAERREARDRLTSLIARAQEESLSDRIPGEIEADVADWDFDAALVALDEREEALRAYLELKVELNDLRTGAEEAGLTLGGELDGALEDWEFDRAADIVSQAEDALSRYVAAKEKLAESRNIWERFGLLGADPDGMLRDAAEAFSAGDYERSQKTASDAIDDVDSAATTATRRVLTVAGGAAAFAVLILLVVWYTRLREQQEDPD